MYVYKMVFHTSSPYFSVLIVSYFWVSPVTDPHKE